MAYHEAGHVVIGRLLQKSLQSVEIGIGEDGESARTSWDWTIPREGEITKEQARSEVLTLMAGHETQQLYAPDSVEDLDRMRDEAMITMTLRRLPTQDARLLGDMKANLRTEVLTLLGRDDVTRAIHAVAERLYCAREPIGGSELTEQVAGLLQNKVILPK